MYELAERSTMEIYQLAPVEPLPPEKIFQDDDDQMSPNPYWSRCNGTIVSEHKNVDQTWGNIGGSPAPAADLLQLTHPEPETGIPTAAPELEELEARAGKRLVRPSIAGKPQKKAVKAAVASQLAEREVKPKSTSVHAVNGKIYRTKK